MTVTRTTHPLTVVGGGAIGGTLAAALLEAGHPVQIIDADAAHVAAVRERGLRITGASGDRVAWVPAFGLEDAPAELGGVLLAVKGQATGRAMTWITPRLAPDGFVVSMQNGLNEEEIAAHIGADRTIAAFVDLFADVLEPGVVKDGGPGAMSIGEFSGPADSPRVRALAEALAGAGAPIISDNVQGYLWSKLAFGSWSSVTALADAEMWELVDRHRPAMRALAVEVSRVAVAEGVRLEDFDAYRAQAFAPGGTDEQQDAVFDDVVAWLKTQPKTRSGVWRDIAVRHRATEVPSHFLPVIAAAERHGIDVPMLRGLLREIGRIERGEISHDEDHLASFDRLAVTAR
ncbi:MAG: 2-dehydropantoate 2-reductase [Microbacterium sp.]